MNKQNCTLWKRALILGFCAAVVLQITLLFFQCDHIENSLLRLHVLANSDSQEDQALKLQVRDCLLQEGGALLQGAENKTQALVLTRQNLDALQAIAQKEIQRQGYDYSVTCGLETTYFETRTYDTVTLPAGYYQALRVVIGEGAGKNWWCVMFPPMCLPAAQEVTADQQQLENVLSAGEVELVENASQYQIKFKTVEVVQSAVRKWKEWFS